MTTPKDPGTLEEAITRVCYGLGGFTVASLSLGYDKSRFAHAANKHKPDGIRVDDALALDKASHEAGHGTPIFDWYKAQLELADGPDLNPHEHLARLSEAVGPLEVGLVRALADGRLTPQEAANAVRDISRLATVLSAALADMTDAMGGAG